MANTSNKAVPSPKPSSAGKPMVSSKPGLFTRMGKFLKETWIELKKTSWPDKDELVKGTVLVLTAVAIITLWIGGLDFILGRVSMAFGL
jgi:preprotein translocase subunit SecE